VRVLHVITGLGAGGAEHQLRLLVRHLPVDCAVATLTNPGSVAAAIRADGIPVFDLGMRHNRDLQVLPRLVALMRRGGYDLVHTHLYRACLYGRVAARLAGVPHVVATEHSLGDTLIEGRPLSAWVRRLYLATERRADATIAVSRAVAGRLVAWGVPPERIAVIPNGIEADRFRYDPALRAACRSRLGLGPQDRVVGAVARLEPAKRLDQLVRALAGLDGATLLVVGDGSQRAALEELARAEGVGSRVRFAGGTADVRPALCAMDVLASPSPEETFGLAVLEALACGLPVVHASCPALEELPPQDAPGARKVAPGAPALHAALAEVLAAGPPAGTRLPPPPAVSRYAAAPLAARVADLYRRVRSGRPPAGHGGTGPVLPPPGTGTGRVPPPSPPAGPVPAGVPPTEES
jgi:glycosyltransferase involved in cell wall biosynthesis